MSICLHSLKRIRRIVEDVFMLFLMNLEEAYACYTKKSFAAILSWGDQSRVKDV